MRKKINNPLTKKVLKAYSELTQAQLFIDGLRLMLHKHVEDPNFDVYPAVMLRATAMPRFSILKNEAMQLKSRIKSFCEGHVSDEVALSALDQLYSQLDEALKLFNDTEIVDFLKS